MKHTWMISNDRNHCLINIFTSKYLKNGFLNSMIHVIALIDTGAERSFISPHLFEKLDLEADGSTTIKGFDGKYDSVYSSILIQIPELMSDPSPMYVMKNENIVDTVFAVILGNDFLTHFVFERDGKNKTFSLSI